ncbi:unnamed protein product [Kuraishia capsulata CBS 1993]|uniref:U1-C C2H2-type zinc finger domain-containing protein n=1 Tax=Kuraishia capsulata CBS 1993 TaxID=1382522 RepID=W6MUE9_9ASCO|nr:uncharacterized protein KUCA_T00005205001 [Kuraishia capsulata CBS 1993]CDK29217.1 unnamed protein product [Kuraishia capsulata CBS 1993]
MGKYWCTTCSLFVDDTKFGRSLHEASSKHKYLTTKIVHDLNRKKREDDKQKKIVDAELHRINKELHIETKKEPTKKGPSYGYAEPWHKKNTNPEDGEAENKEDESEDTKIPQWSTVEQTESSISQTEKVIAQKAFHREHTASEKETKNWELKQKKPDIDDLEEDEIEIPVFKKRKSTKKVSQ